MRLAVARLEILVVAAAVVVLLITKRLKLAEAVVQEL
jgi:hypothetical protein